MVLNTQDILYGITKRLIKELHPERIYLFGSYAYGSPDQQGWGVGVSR